MAISISAHLRSAVLSTMGRFNLIVKDIKEGEGGVHFEFYDTALLSKDDLENRDAGECISHICDHFDRAVATTRMFRKTVNDYEEKIRETEKDNRRLQGLIDDLAPYKHYHRLQMELNHGASAIAK